MDELHETPYFDCGPQDLERPPSEYFMSNCFIGASFMSNADAREAIAQGYEDRYMWGSDFPHIEGTYPWSRQSLRMALEGIDPAVGRKLVGSTLVEVFGLDREALDKVAARIGPTAEELSTPLRPEEMPVEPGVAEYSLGFRTGHGWL
jgi:hypothetical protein